MLGLAAGRRRVEVEARPEGAGRQATAGEGGAARGRGVGEGISGAFCFGAEGEAFMGRRRGSFFFPSFFLCVLGNSCGEATNGNSFFVFRVSFHILFIYYLFRIGTAVNFFIKSEIFGYGYKYNK